MSTYIESNDAYYSIVDPDMVHAIETNNKRKIEKMLDSLSNKAWRDLNDRDIYSGFLYLRFTPGCKEVYMHHDIQPEPYFPYCGDKDYIQSYVRERKQ